MSLTSKDCIVAPDLVDAVRELIRRQDGCVVGISQVLDELSGKFGDRFRVSPEMHQLVDLIYTLWEDPHIDRVNTGWIEFAWNEEGR